MSSARPVTTAGRLPGEPDTADANRDHPRRLWLELRIQGNMLNGPIGVSLIVLPQRERYTGPLAHWV
jgi:hypothetical protein